MTGIISNNDINISNLPYFHDYYHNNSYINNSHNGVNIATDAKTFLSPMITPVTLGVITLQR